MILVRVQGWAPQKCDQCASPIQPIMKLEVGMRYTTIALVILAVSLVYNGGCCSSKYPKFSCDEEMVYNHPFPKRWIDHFYAIRGDYVRNYWDCDDMAQVYSEYLFSQGVEWKDMRLVSAAGFWKNPFTGAIQVDPFRGHHMWLEAWLYDEWWVFDVSSRKWAWKFEGGKRPLNWAKYDVYKFDSAGVPIWDGSGYRELGDRFDLERLVWVSRDGREYSVEERTDVLNRKGVISDLEAIRKQRADRGSSTIK